MQTQHNQVTTPRLSIVIPAHNESEVIAELLARLAEACQQIGEPVEWLFIDDGSQDDTSSMLKNAHITYPMIRVIELSRNFGKEAAASAGLARARGDAVILMDADLQDPPEQIPRMVEQWRSGYDMVLMKRDSRAGESWLKRVSASCFYRLLNRISDAELPVDTGDFRLMSRRVIDAFNELPERNRYLKGMIAWVGMPTITLTFNRDARAAGNTKWNYLKLAQLAMEGITSFSVKPLRLALILGLLAAATGGAFGAWVVLKALLFGVATPGYASIITVITFMSGIQLLCVGLLGEYVGRIYIETKQRPVYLVAHDSADEIQAIKARPESRARRTVSNAISS